MQDQTPKTSKDHTTIKKFPQIVLGIEDENQESLIQRLDNLFTQPNISSIRIERILFCIRFEYTETNKSSLILLQNKWLDYLSTKPLHYMVFIGWQALTEKKLLRLIEKNTHLKQLIIQDCPHFSCSVSTWAKLSVQCPELEVLHLTNVLELPTTVSIRRLNFNFNEPIIFLSLQSLYLENCITLTKYIVNAPKLKKLTIRYFPQLTQVILCKQPIEVLHLQDCVKLTGRGIIHDNAGKYLKQVAIKGCLNIKSSETYCRWPWFIGQLGIFYKETLFRELSNHLQEFINDNSLNEEMVSNIILYFKEWREQQENFSALSVKIRDIIFKLFKYEDAFASATELLIKLYSHTKPVIKKSEINLFTNGIFDKSYKLRGPSMQALVKLAIYLDPAAQTHTLKTLLIMDKYNFYDTETRLFIDAIAQNLQATPETLQVLLNELNDKKPRYQRTIVLTIVLAILETLAPQLQPNNQITEHIINAILNIINCIDKGDTCCTNSLGFAAVKIVGKIVPQLRLQPSLQKTIVTVLLDKVFIKHRSDKESKRDFRHEPGIEAIDENLGIIYPYLEKDLQTEIHKILLEKWNGHRITVANILEQLAPFIQEKTIQQQMLKLILEPLQKIHFDYIGSCTLALGALLPYLELEDQEQALASLFNAISSGHKTRLLYETLGIIYPSLKSKFLQNKLLTYLFNLECQYELEFVTDKVEYVGYGKIYLIIIKDKITKYAIQDHNYHKNFGEFIEPPIEINHIETIKSNKEEYNKLKSKILKTIRENDGTFLLCDPNVIYNIYPHLEQQDRKSAINILLKMLRQGKMSWQAYEKSLEVITELYFYEKSDLALYIHKKALDIAVRLLRNEIDIAKTLSSLMFEQKDKIKVAVSLMFEKLSPFIEDANLYPEIFETFFNINIFLQQKWSIKSIISNAFTAPSLKSSSVNLSFSLIEILFKALEENKHNYDAKHSIINIITNVIPCLNIESQSQALKFFSNIISESLQDHDVVIIATKVLFARLKISDHLMKLLEELIIMTATASGYFKEKFQKFFHEIVFNQMCSEKPQVQTLLINVFLRLLTIENYFFNRIILCEEKPKSLSNDTIALLRDEKSLTAYWFNQRHVIHENIEISNSNILDILKWVSIELSDSKESNDKDFIKIVISTYNCGKNRNYAISVEWYLYELFPHLNPECLNEDFFDKLLVIVEQRLSYCNTNYSNLMKIIVMLYPKYQEIEKEKRILDIILNKNFRLDAFLIDLFPYLTQSSNEKILDKAMLQVNFNYGNPILYRFDTVISEIISKIYIYLEPTIQIKTLETLFQLFEKQNISMNIRIAAAVTLGMLAPYLPQQSISKIQNSLLVAFRDNGLYNSSYIASIGLCNLYKYLDLNNKLKILDVFLMKWGHIGGEAPFGIFTQPEKMHILDKSLIIAGRKKYLVSQNHYQITRSIELFINDLSFTEYWKRRLLFLRNNLNIIENSNIKNQNKLNSLITSEKDEKKDNEPDNLFFILNLSAYNTVEDLVKDNSTSSQDIFFQNLNEQKKSDVINTSTTPLSTNEITETVRTDDNNLQENPPPYNPDYHPPYNPELEKDEFKLQSNDIDVIRPSLEPTIKELEFPEHSNQLISENYFYHNIENRDHFLEGDNTNIHEQQNPPPSFNPELIDNSPQLENTNITNSMIISNNYQFKSQPNLKEKCSIRLKYIIQDLNFLIDNRYSEISIDNESNQVNESEENFWQFSEIISSNTDPQNKENRINEWMQKNECIKLIKEYINRNVEIDEKLIKIFNPAIEELKKTNNLFAYQVDNFKLSPQKLIEFYLETIEHDENPLPRSLKAVMEYIKYNLKNSSLDLLN